jgi:hypothetical protein
MPPFDFDVADETPTTSFFWVRRAAFVTYLSRATLDETNGVASFPLSGEPDIQRGPRLLATPMKVDPAASPFSDAAPFADEGNLVEERRLDCKNVIARHVPRAIDAVQYYELDVLVCRRIAHDANSRSIEQRRPTKRWNQLEPSDSVL